MLERYRQGGLCSRGVILAALHSVNERGEMSDREEASSVRRCACPRGIELVGGGSQELRALGDG